MTSTVTTARTRRLAGVALAATVAATTVSLVPSTAQAAESAESAALQKSVLAVSSLGDQVTLTSVLSGLLAPLGTTDVLFSRPGATWEFAHPATTIQGLATPLTLDADDPSATLSTVRLPAGLDATLPDGTYDVTTVTSLLGLLPLTSNTVETTIRRFTVPSAPTGLTLDPGDVLERFVSWTPPAEDGGRQVQEYVVRLMEGGTELRSVVVSAGEQLRVALGDLSTRVTNVYVTAVNTVGAGLPASAQAALAPPSAPTGVAAVAGNGAATVSWTGSDAGMPVTGYTVTAVPGGATCSTAGTSCTVGGLLNGRAHTFTVTPQSSALQGQTSAPSAPVTPSTVPGTPASLTVAGVGHDTATLRWTAPQDDGGSPVTEYVVTVGGRTVTTTTTQLPVEGLQEQTAYAVSLVARNANGTSTTAATTGFTTTAAPALAASVAPRAERSGRRAALVRVDLTRAATVTVRVVRGRLVASRTLALGDQPTWVTVPVARKVRPLLNGRRVLLQVVADGGAVLASRTGTVRR